MLTARVYARQATDPLAIPTGISGISNAAATVGTELATKTALAVDTSITAARGPNTFSIMMTSTLPEVLADPTTTGLSRRDNVIPLAVVIVACLGTLAVVACLLYIAVRVYRRSSRAKDRHPNSTQNRNVRSEQHRIRSRFETWHKLEDDKPRRTDWDDIYPQTSYLKELDHVSAMEKFTMFKNQPESVVSMNKSVASVNRSAVSMNHANKSTVSVNHANKSAVSMNHANKSTMSMNHANKSTLSLSMNHANQSTVPNKPWEPTWHDDREMPPRYQTGFAAPPIQTSFIPPPVPQPVKPAPAVVEPQRVFLGKLELPPMSPMSWDGETLGKDSPLAQQAPELRGSGAMSPSNIVRGTPQITSFHEPHRWESAEIIHYDSRESRTSVADTESASPFADAPSRHRGRQNSISSPFFGASEDARINIKGKGRARSQSHSRSPRSHARSISTASSGVNPFADVTATSSSRVSRRPSTHAAPPNPKDRALQSLIAALGVAEGAPSPVPETPPLPTQADRSSRSTWVTTSTSNGEGEGEEEDLSSVAAFPMPPVSLPKAS
jgi:hypothetical protein